MQHFLTLRQAEIPTNAYPHTVRKKAIPHMTLLFMFTFNNINFICNDKYFDNNKQTNTKIARKILCYRRKVVSLQNF